MFLLAEIIGKNLENKQKLEALSYEELMRAYQLGSTEAFSEIYRRISGRVYGFIYVRIKNRDEADEIFQKVLLKFHSIRHTYKPTLALMPWIYVITRSVLIDHVRKLARTTKLEKELQDLINEPILEAEALDLNSLKDAGLSAKQLEILSLRFENDFSISEISSKLGLTADNIRQLISRGIRKLRLSLGIKNNERE